MCELSKRCEPDPGLRCSCPDLRTEQGAESDCGSGWRLRPTPILNAACGGPATTNFSPPQKKNGACLKQNGESKSEPPSHTSQAEPPPLAAWGLHTKSRQKRYT